MPVICFSVCMRDRWKRWLVLVRKRFRFGCVFFGVDVADFFFNQIWNMTHGTKFLGGFAHACTAQQSRRTPFCNKRKKKPICNSPFYAA